MRASVTVVDSLVADGGGPRTPTFDDVFSAEFEPAVRTAYLLLGDRDAAVDVAQEAFVQLHLHWRKVRRYDSPGGWVRRVSIRLAARQVRRRIAREAAEDTFSRQTPTAVTTTAPFSDTPLRAAVLALPPAQRAAVVLHYLEDLPVRAVAEALSCSEATARVHLHRGRQRLGAVLDREAP